MINHHVWDVLPLQDHHRPIPSTWACKKNLGAANQITKFKARVCAQGFRKTYNLNFESKSAPTGKLTSLRLLISFTADTGLLIHQLDVKSAFLMCDLEEKVYMLPPLGYKSSENIVLKLNKAIYGLKQASLALYKCLSTLLTSVKFSISLANPCVFWQTDPSPMWRFSKVENLIIFGKDPESFRTQIAQ